MRAVGSAKKEGSCCPETTTVHCKFSFRRCSFCSRTGCLPHAAPLLVGATTAAPYGVFGNLCHFEFAFSLKISHLIQVGRFCGVFGSLYQLREARFCGVFVSPYQLRLAPKLKITKRFKVLHKDP
jgi:hypothetical protein